MQDTFYPGYSVNSVPARARFIVLDRAVRPVSRFIARFVESFDEMEMPSRSPFYRRYPPLREAWQEEYHVVESRSRVSE